MLTLLAGMNGSGKSTVIQAILLAREAASHPHGKTVSLNGIFGLELGTAEDVRNWDSSDGIAIGIQSATNAAQWMFGVPSPEAMYLDVIERPSHPPLLLTGAPRAFTYLAAERLGPRSISHSLPVPPGEIEVGIRGEYCAQIIETLGDRPLEDSLRLHPSNDGRAATFLKYEVERWLEDIARPIEVDTESFPDPSIASLRYRTKGGELVRAPNMGFGISYALPVVLAGLVAVRPGVVIVENPEAHLHPQGQSRIGTFLGWLAGAGIQVILETHSDHVLNGLRRAIGEHRYLQSSDASVLYFESSDRPEPIVHDLSFSPIGGVSGWPRGFFDQYQMDAASLGRIRRRLG